MSWMWSPRWASCSTSNEVPGGAAAATSSLLREKAYRQPEPDILFDVLLLVDQGDMQMHAAAVVLDSLEGAMPFSILSLRMHVECTCTVRRLASTLLHPTLDASEGGLSSLSIPDRRTFPAQSKRRGRDYAAC